MDSRPFDILKELIHGEEKRILATLPGERRWGLLELVRAVDHYLFYVLELDEKNREEEIQSKRWDLFRYGQSKAVSLFTDRSSTLPGASLTRSTQVHQQWADAVIHSCGQLGICEMLLDLHRYSLVELSMPSPNAIHASASLREVGVEAIEANELHIFSDLANRMDQHLRDQSMAIRPDILELMSPLVSPWNDHFLQYDTNPAIDIFFRSQGLLWARSHYEPGQDAFPPNVTFGDLPFQLYKEAVVEVIGWVLKHIAFSSLLLSKHPHLDVRNLLTITAGEDRLHSHLSAAFDMTKMDARQVLDTMKSTPENIQAHTEPAVYIPPFLNVNSTTVVSSIAGTLGSPFDFMLAELYGRYRRDWDHAVNEREEHFRKELYDLFPTQNFVKVERPFRLVDKGTVVTDIDATIFDTTTRTLGLFQLKWQDPFGSSMRKRNSKMLNFLKETNQWVSTVSSILCENPKALDHLLGGQSARIHKAERIRLFVIGRHFSHFSGGVYRDSRSAWGTWPQVLRLFAKSNVGFDPLTWLHRMLQEQSPSRRTPVPVGAYEMQLGEYRISYGPATAH